MQLTHDLVLHTQKLARRRTNPFAAGTLWPLARLTENCVGLEAVPRYLREGTVVVRCVSDRVARSGYWKVLG